MNKTSALFTAEEISLKELAELTKELSPSMQPLSSGFTQYAYRSVNDDYVWVYEDKNFSIEYEEEELEQIKQKLNGKETASAFILEVSKSNRDLDWINKIICSIAAKVECAVYDGLGNFIGYEEIRNECRKRDKPS